MLAIPKNIAASVSRVVSAALVSLAVPAYLSHRLPVSTYAVWVLVLQLAAYISYLEFGVQTGISKFVAEYDAKRDLSGAARHTSAGLLLMLIAAALGLLLTLVLAWQLPNLFKSMPPEYTHDARWGLVFLGSSLAFSLVCAVYSSVFIGLQKYWVPMAISVTNRVVFTAIVLLIVGLRGNLITLCAGTALVNVGTGAAQILAWKNRASHIKIELSLCSLSSLKSMARYCSMQSIWAVGMLCVSGLDILIVGRYDYAQTAYFSIATMPTNFLVMVMGATLGPFMPAASAMNSTATPTEMGLFLAKLTRASSVLLLLTSIPLLLFGAPFLNAWVGHDYAVHTLPYLDVLVLANLIRNLCLPYATVVTGIGRQAAALVAAISEATVNLAASIYLASRLGAIGVALGTLLGAIVSVGLHFAFTMHLTRDEINISRTALLWRGLLRPCVAAIPVLLAWPFWSQLRLDSRWTFESWFIGLSIMAGTVLLAWLLALTVEDRSTFLTVMRHVLFTAQLSRQPERAL